ncbi:MAG TPA: hypothetical protein VF824_12335 [Thermoanaerobaculia bacterium]|jgi:hypothetical protein
MQTLLAVTVLAAIGSSSAFTELQSMCARDGGRMWGREICGPTLLVDPKTREAATFADGVSGSATLPESIGIANTAVDWNGRRWTMVMLPLPEDVIARRALLAHESFHRVQEQLGFAPTSPSNAHLDSADGRYWLRLEWRALARALALAAEGSDASPAVRDALAFRARRRAAFKTAAADERALEMHEGLAEYTGTALAVPVVRERAAYLVAKLANAEAQDRFIRNFAYASGPAWGAVIELRDRRWTRRVKSSDDLGALAARAWKLAPSDGHADAYGGAVLRAEEDARETRKQQERAALRARFIDGPTLTLPLREMQMVFDPNGLQPLDDRGTVYRSITVSDRWGKIVVTGGALMSPDFTKLIVPMGEGYELSLAPGWEIEGGKVIDKR